MTLLVRPRVDMTKTQFARSSGINAPIFIDHVYIKLCRHIKLKSGDFLRLEDSNMFST